MSGGPPSPETAARTPAAKPLAGFLLLILTAALWSLNGPFIKLLNAPRDGSEGASGLAIACYRSLIGGLVLLPFAWGQLQALARRGAQTTGRSPAGRPRPLKAGWFIASVLFFTLMTGCFVIGTTMTEAASVIVLQYTAPIWVLALSPFLLNERPTLREAIPLTLAMVGITIIFVGSLRERPAAAPGLSLALISGLGYGVLIVILRRLQAVNPLVVVTLNTLGSGLLLALIGGVLLVTGGPDLLAVSWLALAILAGMALLQFTLPYALFSLALRHVDATRASLITLLEMLLNPIWTFLAVGEAPPGPTLFGGPIILLAVLLCMRPGALRAPSPRLAGATGEDTG